MTIIPTYVEKTDGPASQHFPVSLRLLDRLDEIEKKKKDWCDDCELCCEGKACSHHRGGVVDER